MARKLSMFFVLALAMVGLLAISAEAHKRPVDKMEAYSFQMKPKAKIATEEPGLPSGSRGVNPSSLGLAEVADFGVGKTVGFTWYDLQQNSSMGRLNDWRAPDPTLHFSFTFGPTNDVSVATGLRAIATQAYEPVTGTFPQTNGCGVVDFTKNRAGFTNLDVSPPDDPGNPDHYSNEVVAFHQVDSIGSEDFRIKVLWDRARGSEQVFCSFDLGNSMEVDSADQAPYESVLCPDENFIWPKVEYHINGTDTFTYAAGMPNCDNTQAIAFFRTAGQKGNGTWESELITDQTDFPGHDMAASRVSRKVCVLFQLGADPANLQANASNIYYRESTNMGAPGSWGDTVNVTQYDWNTGGFRAWLEVAGLYDTPGDNLHIVWPASQVNQGGSDGINNACRIFHWASHLGGPGTGISTVHDATWNDNETCGGLSFNSLNVRAVTISQCNDKLYTVWVQAQNPDQGITDNCANEDEISRGEAGTGDLWLSVSSNLNGNQWDAARNLTNSIFPQCDSNDCQSENWVTMSRYGMNDTTFGTTLTFPTEALQVDPDPSGYMGDWYLDVQFVVDRFPGWGTGNPGQDTKMTRNEINWFRLPCVDIIPEANPILTPNTVEYPFWLRHGQDSVVAVTVENAGTSPMTSTVEVVEIDPVSPTGWLQASETEINLGLAPTNTTTMNVTINAGGIINNPGTMQHVVGAVILHVDPPTTKDSVSVDIDFVIADTLVGIEWDTVATSCVRLAVSNDGGIGQAGGVDGTVNMDFVWGGIDCDNQDPNEDTLPGAAEVYLYDGSPFVVDSVDDTTYVGSWSIFSEDLAGEQSFRPVKDPGGRPSGLLADSLTGPDYLAHWSGFFVNVDSSLMFEQTVYYPQTFTECSWVVQRVAMWAVDGAARNHLVVGNAWDWDIPADTGVNNEAEIIPTGTYTILALKGAEYGVDDQCIANDSRYGGAAFIGYRDGSSGGFNTSHVPERGYTALNEDFVINLGTFDPQELWENVRTIDNFTTAADLDDQHMVITPFQNYDLAAGDTLVFFMVIATVYDGDGIDLENIIDDGYTFVTSSYPLPYRPLDEGCCGEYTGGTTGNVDDDTGGIVDLGDLLYMANAVFLGGSPICCPAKGNTDGDPGCIVDLGDILWLAGAVFLGGSPNAECDPACEVPSPCAK